MQDRAIAAIGKWQFENKKGMEEVDLFIEKMFPSKDYQVLLLVFDLKKDADNNWNCEYKGIDIEKVSKDNDGYLKYAYRKGTSRGGDVTLTTKISKPAEKKMNTIKENVIDRIVNYDKNDEYPETKYFKLIRREFDNSEKIINEIDDFFENISKKEANSIGLSFKIKINDKEHYLRDFQLIKDYLILRASETAYIKYKKTSKAENKMCSVSHELKENIYGFAAPFKYSSVDKDGFVSGFFNKSLNWRNYPISADQILYLELGRKYIEQNLSGYFYGNNYRIVPNPIMKTSKQDLQKIITLLQKAFLEENTKRATKKRSEESVLKIIAKEDNYFNVDMLFYSEDSKTKAISINLMLEEILPSRFRKLFVEVPEKINENPIYKNAIVKKTKKEKLDLVFNYGIIKNFFADNFLEIVQKLFLGTPISEKYVFDRIMSVIRTNYNISQTSDKWAEPMSYSVKKAIMLINYLQELEIIKYNKNYKYNKLMDAENTKKEKTFKLDEFENFVTENKNFLDSDIKIGIFSVGVLTRFLFDIQYANLKNTPFENKLRGYKLNPDLLMKIYTEALDKIQKYQDFYTYSELREIVSKYFVLNYNKLDKLTNNEISFYFVAGLEMGKIFKNKEDKENKENK